MLIVRRLLLAMTAAFFAVVLAATPASAALINTMSTNVTWGAGSVSRFHDSERGYIDVVFSVTDKTNDTRCVTLWRHASNIPSWGRKIVAISCGGGTVSGKIDHIPAEWNKYVVERTGGSYSTLR